MEHEQQSPTRPCDGLRGQLTMPWVATEEPYEVMRRMYVTGGTGE